MSSRLYYILDENDSPVIEHDLYKWARWMQKTERHVADQKIGPYRISTVFLGLDHNYGDKDGPVLWETMIFHDDKNANAELDLEQDRCSGSREQAEAMHARMVERVKAAVL